MMTKKGFTLVELLVVISIIALLLSILMPALSKVRDQGNAIVCANRMKQIGLGFVIYQQNWKNTLPWAHGNPNDQATYSTWEFLIGPLLDNGIPDSKQAAGQVSKKNQIFRCPSDNIKRFPPPYFSQTQYPISSRIPLSYSMVTWRLDGEPYAYEFRPRSMNIFKGSLSEKFMVAEWQYLMNARGINGPGMYINNLPGRDRWNTYLWRDGYYANVYPQKKPSEGYHSKSSNYLFLDGHVEKLIKAKAEGNSRWRHNSSIKYNGEL